EPRRSGAGGPYPGQGDDPEQQEGVDQVQAHHLGTGHRVVRSDQPLQDQRASDHRLETEEDHAEQRPRPYPVSPREGAKCPEEPGEAEDANETGGGPVAVLDERLEARGTRNDLSVADRPVRAAARPRTRGAYEGAPQDDPEEEGDQSPGRPCESPVRHGRWAAYQPAVVAAMLRGAAPTEDDR